MNDDLNIGWTRAAAVNCVVCPDCAFTFDDCHTDCDPVSGESLPTYTCPSCESTKRQGLEQVGYRTPGDPSIWTGVNSYRPERGDTPVWAAADLPVQGEPRP